MDVRSAVAAKAGLGSRVAGFVWLCDAIGSSLALQPSRRRPAEDAVFLPELRFLPIHRSDGQETLVACVEAVQAEGQGASWLVRSRLAFKSVHCGAPTQTVVDLTS